MRTVTSDTTLLESDDVINCDCTNGDITVTLPYGNSIAYLQQFAVVKVDRTAHVVNIVPSSGEAIDGASEIILKKDPLYNAMFRLQAVTGGWHNPASKTPIPAPAGTGVGSILQLTADLPVTASNVGKTWYNITDKTYKKIALDGNGIPRLEIW